MKNNKYKMTYAAKAARMKGAKRTSEKFAAIREKKAKAADALVVVRVSKSLKHWAVDQFGSVNLALNALRQDVADKIAFGGKGVR